MGRALAKLIPALALLCLLCLPAAAGAPEVGEPWYRASQSAEGSTAVYLQEVNGESYLFLPSWADLKSFSLNFEGGTAVIMGQGAYRYIRSGESFDLTLLFSSGERESYPLVFSCGTKLIKFTLMKSQNLRAMFITSPSEEQDRLFVEADKENRAEGGTLVLLRPDGSKVYDGLLEDIHGRGNTTWHEPKKPYRLNLASRCDLLDTGDPMEADKDWVLLANYSDDTHLHNLITQDLAGEIGVPYTPHMAQVDLYYDGLYRGLYDLSEKTEVGAGRVNVADLDKALKKENPDLDPENCETVRVRLENGAEYQYVAGVKDPADITGGYLAEIDYEMRARGEAAFIKTRNNKYVALVTPELASKAMTEYFFDCYTLFEEAIFNGGVHPETGQPYTDYMDGDSLARSYLIMELAADNDSFTSSTYLHLDAGGEKFYFGPLWDFDSGYGTYFEEDVTFAFVAGKTAIGNRLLAIPDFQERVKRIFKEELLPAVRGVLLAGGDARGDRVRSLDSYFSGCAASRRMDDVLWLGEKKTPPDKAEEYFRTFISRRIGFLETEINRWDGSPATSPMFIDVPDNSVYYDAVSYVQNVGIFRGTAEMSFSPEGDFTRAMAVTVLYRTVGSPLMANEYEFSDMGTVGWYVQPFTWAVEKGVVKPEKGNTLRPWDVTTVGELCGMLYNYGRAADLSPGERSGEKYPTQAMSWCAALGLIQPGEQDAARPLTRADGALIFQRLHLLLSAR